MVSGKDNGRETINMSLIQMECAKAYPIRDFHAEKKELLLYFTPEKDQKFTTLEII
jgi:hypothetical protein